MKLEYRQGCVVAAFKNGEFDYLAHGVNCQGVMGSGVAKLIKQEFPGVFEKYCEWVHFYKTCRGIHQLLGECQVVATQPGDVINLFTQEYFGTAPNRYVNYMAIVKSFDDCFRFIGNSTLGIPRIGAGLGGGDWGIISQLIEDTAKASDFKGQVIVYDL